MQTGLQINSPTCAQKAEIAYPCIWLYKVIGADPEALTRAITTVCSAQARITPSQTSSGGKYHSLNVELEVNTEEERLALYQHLKNHMAVKMVL